MPIPAAIPVRKADAACGAEIEFDLSRPIDDATFAELERHFHDNIVVFFRDQRLTEEQQIAFSRRFGELEIHIVKKYLLPGPSRDSADLEFRDENGEHIGLADAGFTWHSDTSYRRYPSRCSLLYAKEVPHRDGKPLGDTVFANTIAAYEALPDTMKRRLERAESNPSLFDAAPHRQLAAPEADRRSARRDARHRASDRAHASPYRAQGAVRDRRRMHRHRGHARGRGARPDRRTRRALRASPNSAIATGGGSAIWSCGTMPARCISRSATTRCRNAG